ncbi:hypothetical protein IAD21_05949 [Abditibacteriota bacterium]|nr:hypothetical protein IAD21_05949 [Abditibacteriota bacterium]
MPVSSSLLFVLVCVLFVCVLLQCAFLLGMSRRMARHSKMLRQFFSGPQGEDLEGLLSRTLENAQVATDTARATSIQMAEFLERFDGCIQHFALVRYDAFEEVTGQLSFSLAMLDGRDNGAIISTIFGRTNSRCFGKMIVGGRPEQALTDEEQEALLQALESKAKVAVKKQSEDLNKKTAVIMPTAKRGELVGAGRE